MVRLPRPVWIQLAILAVITAVTLGVMAFGFVHLPALLGIGRYRGASNCRLPAAFTRRRWSTTAAPKWGG